MERNGGYERSERPPPRPPPLAITTSSSSPIHAAAAAAASAPPLESRNLPFPNLAAKFSGETAMEVPPFARPNRASPLAWEADFLERTNLTMSTVEYALPTAIMTSPSFVAEGAGGSQICAMYSFQAFSEMINERNAEPGMIDVFLLPHLPLNDVSDVYDQIGSGDAPYRISNGPMLLNKVNAYRELIRVGKELAPLEGLILSRKALRTSCLSVLIALSLYSNQMVKTSHCHLTCLQQLSFYSSGNLILSRPVRWQRRPDAASCWQLFWQCSGPPVTTLWRMNSQSGRVMQSP